MSKMVWEVVVGLKRSEGTVKIGREYGREEKWEKRGDGSVL